MTLSHIKKKVTEDNQYSNLQGKQRGLDITVITMLSAILEFEITECGQNAYRMSTSISRISSLVELIS